MSYCFWKKFAQSTKCTRSGYFVPTRQEHDVPQNFVDFKKYLRTEKLQHKDGHTCLQVICRLCDRYKQSGYKLNLNAFVNKRTGVFLCPNCDIKKTLPEAMRIYAKAQPVAAITVAYISPVKQLSVLTQELCDSLEIRNLRADKLIALGVMYNPISHSLHFPLRNAAHKVVGEQILRIFERKEETLPSANCSGLLMQQSDVSPVGKTKGLLVSNLLDFLVLSTQRLDDHCVICLPYGLRSLPQECLPALEPFEEIIFWFDYGDSSEWDSAKIYANKIGEQRCLLIRPTATEPAPYAVQCAGLNLRHILQRAIPVRHKSITTFSALRNDVLSELQNIEKVNGVKWRRYPILNKLLKGHRKGELTIITGPTGSGKTTFMSEYSLDLAMQGVSTLWGSFELRNSRLAATLLRQFVGYSLESHLPEFDRWANAFEKFPLYFMTFHGQQSLKVVMEAIQHAQYVHDINHVIIDNLQFMMGISASYRVDKFWEQDAIIAAFRAFATKHNVHVTLVMHPRKERDSEDLTTSSIFGTAKATQEADNVLIIQDKRLTSLRGKKYLQVVKNRYSGDLGIMPLNFDKESLSYMTKPLPVKNDKKDESM